MEHETLGMDMEYGDPNQYILGLEVHQELTCDPSGADYIIVFSETKQVQPHTHLLTSPITHL